MLGQTKEHCNSTTESLDADGQLKAIWGEHSAKDYVLIKGDLNVIVDFPYSYLGCMTGDHSLSDSNSNDKRGEMSTNF